MTWQPMNLSILTAEDEERWRLAQTQIQTPEAT